MFAIIYVTKLCPTVVNGDPPQYKTKLMDRPQTKASAHPQLKQEKSSIYNILSICNIKVLKSPPPAHKGHRQKLLFISSQMLSINVQWLVLGGASICYLGTCPSVSNALFGTFEDIFAI